MTAAGQIELPKVTPHPLVPWLPEEEIRSLLMHPDGAAALSELAAERENLLALVRHDAFNNGFEFPHWRDADRLAHSKLVTYASGGKRASKSWWAAKRVVEAAVLYPGSKIWCFQGSDTTSISEQQGVIWHYFPPNLRTLNNKRHPVYKIAYSEANGFSASPRNKFILPNHSQVHFLTYNQDPQEYEGWKLGCERHIVERVQAELRRKNVERWKAESGKQKAESRGWEDLSEAERWLVEWRGVPPNVGAWADEKLMLRWLQTLKLRCSDHGARILWTFSSMEGLTETMKEVIGAAKTIESRPAELLSDRVNVEDCPRGHMPYIQQPPDPKMGVIYFFSQFNPLGNYAGPGGVRELCTGKDSRYVEMHAYGYARDVAMRKFPNFGPWNVVPHASIPTGGTMFTVTDPAGERPWCTIWVRVLPGWPRPSHYIVMDWPDAQTYGEWSLPDDGGAAGQKTKHDGKVGPAQSPLGMGYGRFKHLLVTLEKREGYVVSERYIDPRAGQTATTAGAGEKKSLIMCLADDDTITGDLGEPIKVPGMDFLPVPCKVNDEGSEIGEGIGRVNDMLDWNRQAPLVLGQNAPALFVSDRCLQVIWAMSNWTGKDGQKGASKDFADLVRYMAQAELMHLDPALLEGKWGGAY